MQDLQLIGVHEDGEHLLLSGADDSRFLLPVDDMLRAAIRRDRPRLGQQQIEADGGLRPRDVQALIRAGASTDEAASRAGWTVEKVHRYEGPILAEREHVAGLAQKARLRTRNGIAGGVAPTLSARVAERLKSRDVEVTETNWDSWRAEGGPWTVVLTFAAGGRQRQASWSFDLADRTVSAVDDEARWLSEEVQTAKGPIPAPPHRPSPGRDTPVYDVEAEGGLRPVSRDEHQDDPLDLMSAMRKRSSARGRRRPGGHNPTSAPTVSPGAVSPGAVPPGAVPPSAVPPSAESPSAVTPSAVSPSAVTPSADSPVSHARQAVPDPPGADRQSLDETLPLQDLETAQTAPRTAQADATRDPSRSALAQEPDGHTGTEAATGADAEDGHPVNDREPDDREPVEVSAAEASPEQASPVKSDQSDQAPERSAQRSQTKARKRPRESARKTGRPSVPAWDEIMFGSRPGADRSSS